MNLAIDPIEALWLAVNLVTFVVTMAGLLDALSNRRAITLLNGHAREIVANGAVEAEVLRLGKASLLVGVGVPGLFIDRPVSLSFPVVCLMGMALLLMVAALRAAWRRRQLTVITAAELVVERDSDIKQLLAAIAENTRISQGARDDAHEAATAANKAYHEANSVNAKIAAQGEAIVIQGEEIVAQGEEAAADRTASESIGELIGTTAAEVHDLHQGHAPRKS